VIHRIGEDPEARPSRGPFVPDSPSHGKKANSSRTLQGTTSKGSLFVDWYYIGHYGQLGPLSLEQMDELIQGGVISHETYVWKTGMQDWLQAGSASELQRSFAATAPFSAPPPPPILGPSAPNPGGMSTSTSTSFGSSSTFAPPVAYSYPTPYGGNFLALRSDRNRVLAGILQFLIPGVGRLYLGYAAIGVMQLLSACMLIGYIWSVIDGIVMLAGGVKLDGYGRVLSD